MGMFEIIIISFLAGLMTVFGALITLSIKKASRRTLGAILGLASGIMLGVVFLDLLPSSWQLGGGSALFGGLIFGWLIVSILAKVMGIGQNADARGSQLYLVKLGYLVATGIALHDLPEGIAIAAGYAATPHLGWMITLAIGLHNIPEGMAMAAPLLMGGKSGGKILGTSFLVSLVTPVGAMLGLFILKASPHLIAFLLSLAGGTMLYIVLKELWLEGKRQHLAFTVLGGILGLAIVLVLSIIE